MDINPLLARELRARWRNMRAFGLIFVYVALLTIAMLSSYTYFVEYVSEDQWRQRLSALGHGMFHTLTWIQTLAWVLVAPALTATSIAGERERGLLEGVQLSALSPWRIVSGKLLSVLSFILLMMIVPLPILATSFLMGGVSPGEFMLAALLQGVTALTCAVMGLFCSAWSRRAGEALRASFALVLLWNVTSGIAFPIAARVWSAGPTSSTLEQIRLELATLYSYTSPIIAALSISDPNTTSRLAGAGLSTWVLQLPVWAISIGFQAAMALLLLWSAARALHRPFDESRGVEIRPSALRHTFKMAPITPAPDHSTMSRAGNAQGHSVNASRHAVETSVLWELPLPHWLRFHNPVLQRELRSKFRTRRPNQVMLALEAGVGIFLLYCFLRALWWALFSPDTRGSLWWGISCLLMLLVIFGAAIMGAATFTRERETGTWEAIQLSLLAPRTIIIGKLIAPLLLCLIFSLPFWPILMLCIDRLGFGMGNSFWFGNGVGLVQAILATGIYAATAWGLTAWGMLLSWQCRNTSLATGWALGTLFLPLVIIPALIESLFSLPINRYALHAFMSYWHPFYALNALVNARYYPIDDFTPAVLMALGYMLLYIVGGCMLLLLLQHHMRRNVWEKEQRSSLVLNG